MKALLACFTTIREHQNLQPLEFNAHITETLFNWSPYQSPIKIPTPCSYLEPLFGRNPHYHKNNKKKHIFHTNHNQSTRKKQENQSKTLNIKTTQHRHESKSYLAIGRQSGKCHPHKGYRRVRRWCLRGATSHRRRGGWC